MDPNEHIWGNNLEIDVSGTLYSTSHELEDFVGVYASHDQGMSWNLATFTDRPNVANHRIITDGIGGVYFFSMTDVGTDKVYSNYSYDGYTWSSVQTNALGANEVSAQIDDYAITADHNGNLYHAWLDMNPSSNAVKFNRSLDRGVTWQETSTVIGNHEGLGSNAVVTSDDSGHVYVVWEVRRSSNPDRHEVYSTYSDDYGSSWQAEPTLVFSRDTNEILNISLESDNNGNIYIFGGAKGQRVSFYVSRDYGQSWSGTPDISSYLGGGKFRTATDEDGRLVIIATSGSDHYVNIIYSNDYGEIWSEHTNLYTQIQGERSSVEVVTDKNGKFYCTWVYEDEFAFTATLAIPLGDEPGNKSPSRKSGPPAPSKNPANPS